jgi:hypothetical protein
MGLSPKRECARAHAVYPGISVLRAYLPEREPLTRRWLVGILSALAAAAVAAGVPAAIAPANAPATHSSATRSSSTTALGASLPAARAAAAQPAATGAPRAVRAFDEAGLSTGLGDDFTAADWSTITRDGFRLFITDPIEWSSECSDGNCTSPVNTCTLDPAAVAQIQDAYDHGIDYAVYTRNVNCLRAAIEGLPSTLQAHMSFALLDIEPGPGVPITPALIHGVTAAGQIPVIYSYQWGWQAVMLGSSAFSGDPLQDGEVPNWGVQFPAPYPAGYPVLPAMPSPYGGWSGHDARIEQQQCCTDIQGPAGAIGNRSDQIDLDSVNAAWLASLPQHA